MKSPDRYSDCDNQKCNSKAESCGKYSVGWSTYKRARRLKRSRIKINSRLYSSNRLEPNENELVKHELTALTSCCCDNNNKTSNGQLKSNVNRIKLLHSNRATRVKRLLDNRFTLKSIRQQLLISIILSYLLLQLDDNIQQQTKFAYKLKPISLTVEGSLIIGDSAIEIQEVDDQQQQQRNNINSNNDNQQDDGQQNQQLQQQQKVKLQDEIKQQTSDIILGSADQLDAPPQYQTNSNESPLIQIEPAQQTDQPKPIIDTSQKSLESSSNKNLNRLPSGPLPPLSKSPTNDDSTEADNKLRNADQDRDSKDFLTDVISAPANGDDAKPEKTITGKVVDFELQPAGGHNKAKIKKKKKKKKMMKSEEAFKKWGKKKKAEKKAMEKSEKKHMKKKKEEGKKKKKKWGLDVHGQKKKGSFKKKKWGKKVKKGKGVKKGKKGKKFLKDKGHKNTGFKTVYHKEEWGKSAKWHDIKREKKWDEKSKKWKKKWKKEKGKKYKGDHMKKFEKKKKEGKKYKKAKEEKFKKFKKEKFEKGKKKKMEEHKKKKEGGVKKEEMEKKKKKKKKKP